MFQNGKNLRNGQKWSKSPKMVKMVKNGQNGLKWSKMVKNGQKWSKMVKMVKNGEPDLKRARRTGPSARRARGTKSRGPKGIELEVGARRAPRLLVQYIPIIPHPQLPSPFLHPALESRLPALTASAAFRCKPSSLNIGI